MKREEECGCGQHGEHQREHYEERHEGHNEDCGCGGHRHHAESCGCGCHQHHRVHGLGQHHGGCRCECHHHEGIGFRRHFIPREEIIARLEEYLKQLQAEAKGVEERITELKTKGESQEA